MSSHGNQPLPFSPQQQIAHDGNLAHYSVDLIQRDDCALQVHTAGVEIDAARDCEAKGTTVGAQLSHRDHPVYQGDIAHQMGKRQAIAAQRVEDSGKRRNSEKPGEERGVMDGKVLDLDGPLEWSIWSWSCCLSLDGQTATCNPVVEVASAQCSAEIVGSDGQRVRPLRCGSVLHSDREGLR